MKQNSENNNEWKRLEEVITWTGMSTNYFARFIGLPRGENLYQIRKGNNGISKDVAHKVAQKFPEINEMWLLTGNGEMFAPPQLPGHKIPFYRQDAEQVLPRLEQINPDEQICFTLFDDQCIALIYMSRAMHPRIPTGSIIFLREITPEQIFPGNDYMLLCGDQALLRTVRTSPKPDAWRLEPANREDFDEWEVPASFINKVWKVMGHLTTTK